MKFSKAEGWNVFLLLKSIEQNFCPHVSTEFMDLFINEFFVGAQNFQLTMYFLRFLIPTGNINVVKLIHLKFNVLFSRRYSQKNKTGVLELKELKELLSFALRKDYVEIFQILVQYANLTKLECEKELKETKFSIIKETILLKND
ncbi:hypothetical protein DICPUDRAFT_158988 [Dictyostelium purpureum]|uniref:Uncharacterized protein n=1 Tax=Dictyostelium purpureum TaxID=5786 RepID=F1A2Z7_DICPU|nr:uncharacterized protein DICPUDRAFT_158988 [Dictyostelium purpureum]EGC29430.1 hypothetical protein DICPUDRAFT_158988 [Dictyostelium purpureum]|eukprot:XP_003294041.1 hypothetical protein DICPUDRAFT_158988 [Dictyostelium purpureum]